MTWLKGEFITKTTKKPDHKCAVHYCGKMVPATVVMCREHWLKVSEDTRDRIMYYFRPDKSAEGQWQEFKVAVDDAVWEMSECRKKRLQKTRKPC